MKTERQINTAINRTFKKLEKIAGRSDKDAFNPYKDIFLYNRHFYATDGICLVRVNWLRTVNLPNAEQNTYYKVTVIDQVEQVRPVFHLEQDEQTEKMDYDQNQRGMERFDHFFKPGKPVEKLAVDPKYLTELLSIYAANKMAPTVKTDKSKFILSGVNGFCIVDSVLMGIRR